MHRRKLHRYLFLTGICMIPLSVIMFITGSGMFVSRGNYSHLIIRTCELCFALWLPVLIMGMILCIVGILLKIYKPEKNKI